MGLLCSFHFTRNALQNDAYALSGLLSTIRSGIDIQAKLEERHVYHQDEVNELCKVVFKPKAVQTPTDYAKTNAAIDPAVGRFTALEEDDRAEFRRLLITFGKLYSFLSQVV